MFTHMLPIQNVVHNVRNTDYEIVVYQVQKTEEYRIFVVKGGFGVGPTFSASKEVVSNAQATAGTDILKSLIETAKGDIDRNEFGHY